MPVFLKIFLILVPFLLLCLAYLYAFHLQNRTRFIQKGLFLLFHCFVALLIAGECINGFSQAQGFHAGLTGLGLLTILAVYSIRYIRAVRQPLGDTVKSFLAVAKEDFQESGASAPVHWIAGVGFFLAFLFLFYVCSTTYFTFNFHIQYFTYSFLQVVEQIADEMSLFDLITVGQCATPLVYNPFTFLVHGLTELTGGIDPAIYFDIRIGLVLIVFVVNFIMYFKRLGWTFLLSHLYFLFITLDSRFEFNGSGDDEMFFALIFFVSFQLLMSIRYQVWFLFLAGFATGVAFLSKELAIFNVLLLSYVLGTAGLSKGRFIKLAIAAALGFLLPNIFFFYLFLHCGTTQGLAHLPVAWFRGHVLRTSLEQRNVYLLNDMGFQFTVWDIIIRRLCFQTVGEMLAGASRHFVHYLCLGVFPVFYLLANLPDLKRRLVLAFLLMGAFLYGFTYWKGGDSSDPLYTMLPFGYVFAAPFLVKLVRSVVRAYRAKRLLAPRSWYLYFLVLLNVLFLVQLAGPAMGVFREFRFIERITPRGIEYGVEPTRKEAALLDVLTELKEQDKLAEFVSADGCWGKRHLKFLVASDPDIQLKWIGIRYSLMKALAEQNHDRIRNAFDILARDFGYRIHEMEQHFVLSCVREGLPSLDEGASLLGGCVEILYTDIEQNRLVLWRLNLKRCKPYLRSDYPASTKYRWH